MGTSNPQDTDTVGNLLKECCVEARERGEKANNMDFAGHDPVRLLMAEETNRF